MTEKYPYRVMVKGRVVAQCESLSDALRIYDGRRGAGARDIHIIDEDGLIVHTE